MTHLRPYQSLPGVSPQVVSPGPGPGARCITRGAVYATGLSNGGGFLFELARDARTAGRPASLKRPLATA